MGRMGLSETKPPLKAKPVNFQTTEKRRSILPKMEIFFVLKNTIKLDQFGQNWTKVNIMMFALDLLGTLDILSR